MSHRAESSTSKLQSNCLMTLLPDAPPRSQYVNIFTIGNCTYLHVVHLVWKSTIFLMQMSVSKEKKKKKKHGRVDQMIIHWKNGSVNMHWNPITRHNIYIYIWTEQTPTLSSLTDPGIPPCSFCCLFVFISHWGQDKMSAISQMTFSNVFSSMYEFHLRFHWNLFLRSQYSSIGSDNGLVPQAPGDKPLSELMMVSLLTHICVTWPQWVMRVGTLLALLRTQVLVNWWRP